MDGESRQRRDWRRRIVGAIRTDASSRPMTEALLTIDEVYARKVIDLAMRIAEALTAVGASANDVALATIRVSGALGIRPVHVDVTYNSIGVSYHRGDADLPITLLRVVRAPVPTTRSCSGCRRSSSRSRAASSSSRRAPSSTPSAACRSCTGRRSSSSRRGC